MTKNLPTFRSVFFTVTLIVSLFLGSLQQSRAAYCTPTFGFSACAYTNDFWITSVSMGTLNFTGGTCGSGLQAATGTVTAGSTYTLTITRHGNTYKTFMTAYADWTGSGQFTSPVPTTLMSTSNAAGGSLTYTASVTVPAGAFIGSVRIRVISKYNTAGAVCNSGGQGEYKDFNITVAASCTAPTTQAVWQSPTGTSTSQTTINFTRGNGTGGVVVLAHSGSTVNASPVSGTVYSNTGASVFGAGTQVGTGNYVVYASTTAGDGVTNIPVTVTGLTNGTTYYFSVFEYASTATCYNTAGATGSVLIQAPCSGTPTAGTAAAVTSSLCPNGTTTLNLTGYSTGSSGIVFQWQQSTDNITFTNVSGGSGGVTASYTTPALANATLAAIPYYYNCIVTCQTGPSSATSNTVTLTVNPTPSLKINGSNTYSTNLCSIGSPSSITLTTTNAASGSTTYSWSPATGLSSSSISNPVATPTVTTTYTVTGTANTCTATATAAVTVNPGLITFTPASPSIGIGSAVAVTAAATSTNGTVSYAWASPSDGSLSTLSGATVTANPLSTETYTVTASDPSGCSRTATVTVNVTSGTPGKVACGYTYSSSAAWTTAAGLTSLGSTGSSNYTVDLSGLSTPFNFDFNGVTYSKFGVNGNGWIYLGTVTPTATITTPLSSGLTVDGVICAWGGPISSSTVGWVVTGTAPNRVLTIQWGATTLAAQFPSQGFSCQVKLNEHGGTLSDVISFAYANQSGELTNASGSYQIGLRGASDADFNNRSLAAGTKMTSASTAAGGTNTAVVAFNASSYINGNVTFTYTPAIATPTISPNTTQNICLGNSTTLTGTSTLPASPTTWLWQLSGSGAPGTNNGSTYSANPGSAGNYFYTVKVTNATGCSRTSYAEAVTAASCCTAPSTQATTFAGNLISQSSVHVNWARGNGDSVIVVANAGSAVSTNPTPGTAYGANAAFGSGSALGTGYVVYNGTGNGVDVTNLTAGTTYYFAVYEFYNDGTYSLCYKTPALTGNVSIPSCAAPVTQTSGFGSASITTNSATINWTRGNGNDVLVIASAGSPPNANPTIGSAYTANAAYGTSGTAIGSGYVVYNGTGTSVPLTNLLPNTTYYFTLYEYASAGDCYNTNPLTGNITTTNGAMTYNSSTYNQQTGTVTAGTANTSIAALQIATGPGTSPSLTLSSLIFNTNGSTTTADFTAARVYYTGTSSTFSTTTQFGTDVTTFPGGTNPITISGTQTLQPGTNYFWLVYDVSIAGTSGDLLQGQITSINVGSAQTPALGTSGNKVISAASSLSCAYTGSSQSVAFSTIVGASGTTSIASGTGIDDQYYAGNSFPGGFTFQFNGNSYSTFGIDANGFIWFGAGTPGTTYSAFGGTPIGSSSANLGGSGVLSGLLVAVGDDLVSHYHLSASPNPTQISVNYSGTSPNQVCTIEWTGFQQKSLGTNDACTQYGYNDDARLDFQILLYQNGGTNSNRIEFHYRNQGPFCIYDSRSFQIGIRGTSNTDYQTRDNSGQFTSSSTTNGVSANDVLSFSSTTWINGNSVAVRYQPNINIPVITPSPATNVCPAVTVPLSTTSSATTLQWYLNGAAINGATTTAYTATVGGTYILSASTNGCGALSSPDVVTINPNPTKYNVTGGTNCGSTTVGLDNSQSGVTYQLYLGSTSTGAPVTGIDGFARNFGAQSAPGTYTIIATNNTGGCFDTMSGSAIVTANPTIYTVGGGTNCGSSDVTLSGSDNGINYQLYNGASTVGAAKPGTGSSLDFGAQSASGTYTVVATNATTSCTATMSGSAIVNPNPSVYTVTGGTNCGSTTVGISNSDPGVSYQLFNGASAVGTPDIGGVGFSRIFGTFSTPGTYTVVATATSTGCVSNMSGSAIVEANPSLYTVGGGTNCGSSDVTLSGSDNGINYQLYNGASTVGAAKPGTGSSLDFGAQSASGTYTVVATDATTACTATMSGSSIVNTNPTAFNVTGGTNCGSTTVGVDNTQSGVDYQLYNGASTVGTPATGTGFAYNYGAQTTAGTYTVIGTVEATGCITNMSGSAVVLANPTVYTVGGGTNCASSDVTLSGSDNGINYQLYNGASTVGAAKPGTGSGLDFGSQGAAGTYTITATNATNGCSLNMSGSSVVSGTVTPSVSIAITTGAQTICPGTGVNFTATPTNGGVSPDYNWQLNGTTVQDGSANFYSNSSLNNGDQVNVILTSSASCASPATATSNTITETVNPTPVFTANATDVTCNGAGDGKITVNVSVGTAPFNYSLDGGSTYPYNSSPITGLSPNNYSVAIVDNNGCASSGSIQVSVGQPGVLSAGATNGGPYGTTQTIHLFASQSGGTSPYTYSWYDGATFISASQNPTIANATTGMSGTYDVTVTDANLCSASASTGVVVSATTVYTWTGASSTDWTIPGNWIPASPVGGPNSCAADVIIPVTGTQPVIPASTPISVGNFQINANAQLTLSSNLSVCKNWTGGTGASGNITGTGLVILNGSIAQNISGKTVFAELVLDNTAGASLQSSSSASILTALDLKSGNFDATNGNLTFLSTSVSQVGIIDNFSAGYQGTLSGSINAQRYYDASGTGGRNQHFMGSPVNTPALSQFGASGNSGFVTPKPNCDETQMAVGSNYGTVFSYHESAPAAAICGEAQWKVETGGNAVNGQGYSILKLGGGTVTVNGTANLNTSYTVSGVTNSNWSNTSLQSRSMSSGWQLVANPYLATLQINSTNAGIDNQVQVWNDNGPFAGTYQVGFVSDNAIIAPFQGFMVHKTSTGGSIGYTLNASDRVRTPQTFYAQNDNSLDILAQNIETGLMDKTTIAFNTHATDGFDPAFDGDKFGGALNRHTLYSLNNNKWMARNVLNSVSTTSLVAVGFEPGATGNFAFTFNNLNTFDPTTYIYLEDKQAGVMYNVRNGNYTFSADSADEWNRFALHFTPPAQIATEASTCSAKGSINIIQAGPANWNYTISDAANNTLATGILNQSSPIHVTADGGDYTLTLVDNNNYAVTKTINVAGAPLTTAAFNAPATAIAGASVNLASTSQNATTYNWYFSDGGIITGVKDATYTFDDPGTYTVMLEVTNAAGCTSSITKTIIIGAPTAIKNVSGNGELNMWSYENRVFVDFTAVDKVDAVINIYNILGQQLSSEKYHNNLVYQKEIDNIAAAYIIVSVRNEDQTITRKLFIVNPK